MTALIRSEILKIRSTQVWFWMLLLAVAVSVLGTIAELSDLSHGQPAAETNYYDIFTSTRHGFIAMVILGVLGFTTEFRHKTITTTVLATPNRWLVLVGKSISYAFFAAIYAVVCLLVDVIIAVIWLHQSAVPIEFGDGVGGGIVKAFLILVLLGLFGLGLGALIRNQAASMVVGIVYFFVLSPLISAIPKVRLGYKYTPSGAVEAFGSGPHRHEFADDVHLLPPIAGGLLTLAWVTLLLLLGGYLSLQRDIT